MFLVFNSMTVASDNPGGYRFVQAEVAPNPSQGDRKEIKLTFSRPMSLGYPTAYWIDPPSPKRGYLQEAAGEKPGELVVWVPMDYPADLAAIRLALITEQPSKSESRWTLSGFPVQNSTPPQLRTYQDIGQGVTVRGEASVDPVGGTFWSKLNLVDPQTEPGWYWEGSSQSPYSSTAPKETDPFWTEQKLTDSPGSLYGYNPFISRFDRVKAEGCLTHFNSCEETIECPLKAAPNPDGQPDSQWWHLEGETVAYTPTGLKLTFHTSKNGMVYSGPSHKKWLLIGIEIDPSTLAKGLSRDPDRLDLDLISKVQKGVIVHGKSVQAWKRNPREFGVLIFDDDVSSDIQLKVKVDRRIADRSLPFSLVLPLKPRDDSPQRPSTTVKP